jgi:long-chain acyl-CoA synthetase
VSGHDSARSAEQDRSQAEEYEKRDATSPATAGAKRAEHPEVPSFRSSEDERADYIFPHWPWWGLVQAARVAFLEGIAQPLVRILAKPKVAAPYAVPDGEPIFIICNHVTAYDGPLVLYALPGRMRRRVAAMMSGEMLEDFRHFRIPERGPLGRKRFMLFGPLAYWLLTALYNVFPLPRRRDFQRSFSHAGEALDHGYNVLVFPEGTRSAEGVLARFRPGIGLLVKQSHTAVLPVAILGLGELKARGRRWFRSGRIEVRVGELLRFGPEEAEAAITERLHAEVESLMEGVRG